MIGRVALVFMPHFVISSNCFIEEHRFIGIMYAEFCEKLIETVGPPFYDRPFNWDVSVIVLHIPYVLWEQWVVRMLAMFKGKLETVESYLEWMLRHTYVNLCLHCYCDHASLYTQYRLLKNCHWDNIQYFSAIVAAFDRNFFFSVKIAVIAFHDDDMLGMQL